MDSSAETVRAAVSATNTCCGSATAASSCWATRVRRSTAAESIGLRLARSSPSRERTICSWAGLAKACADSCSTPGASRFRASTELVAARSP